MAAVLVLLLIGFTFNSASAFTTFFSQRFGDLGGRIICVILRDVLGIPVWVLGYVMAVRLNSAEVFTPTFVSSITAWLLIIAGAILQVVGLIALRWRAAAPSIKDTLVTGGIYNHIRHPLYSGLILELVGLFLYTPTISVLIACGLGLIWVMVQARLEELDLQKRRPEYVVYMRQVPRFIPKLKAN